MNQLQMFLSKMDIGGEGALILEVFIIVLVTVIGGYLQRRILGKLRRSFEKTKNPWDDAVIDALDRPVTMLFWVVGISFAAYIVGERSGRAIFGAVIPLLTIAVIAISAWFLIRFTRRAETLLVDESVEETPTWDLTTTRAMGKMLRLAVIITAVLIGMQSLGLNVSGLLAVGGVGGLAVGMAAKDLLANFFGGLMLYLDRPIAVGDWIRSPDRNIEGVVEDIGWRLTRIRTFDKRPVYVPNSLFTTMVVENPSRMSHRRLRETIGIRYDDLGTMQAITDDVRTLLEQCPDIDQDQTLMVHFDAFGPSSCDFFIYTFTRTVVWVEFHEIKQRLLLQIADIIEGHGAEMAFPTQTLHIVGDGANESSGATPAPMGEPRPALSAEESPAARPQ